MAERTYDRAYEDCFFRHPTIESDCSSVMDATNTGCYTNTYIAVMVFTMPGKGPRCVATLKVRASRLQCGACFFGKLRRFYGRLKGGYCMLHCETHQSLSNRGWI